MSIKDTLQESFKTYAGMTIVDRAICDARDCLKPSTRMSIYAQYIEGIVADKPYRKAQKSVAAAMDHFYVHGDMSLYPLLARLGKPFAMRYIIEDFQGNTGTVEESNNQAASRYTEMRLAPLAMNFFTNIEKDTISKWYDSYSGEEQYPAVLPSIGFYNIINGTSGIATGISSSIPQFNLREVNSAMAKLLKNPNIDDEELICLPDFCSGAILLNKNEVIESLKKGTGAACKLRSVIDYDSKENKFVVSEIPYSVYTETIREQLDTIKCGEDNPGIDRYLDGSGVTPNIEIYLTKGANPTKVLKHLYKNTSLQYYYPINMLMLDNGKTPKIFTWKEALQSHIEHEKTVYLKGFNYDLDKNIKRVHIINGLVICCAHIEEVIATIKASESPAAASVELQKKYNLDEIQAKAILDMKLSRIAHLEVEKLNKEKTNLDNEIKRITDILSNENLFNQQIINGWEETAKKFGDERRTKVINEDTSEEATEIKKMQISLTNQNNLYIEESSNLYTQKRGGVGNKIKLNKNESVIDTISAMTNDVILVFADNGNYYHFNASELNINNKVSLYSILNITDNENIIAITSFNPDNNNKNNILFITKNGFLKKSEISEYNITKNIKSKALVLEDNDKIVSILFANDEKVGILSNDGNLLITETNDIRPIGRVAKGIHVIKLNTNAYVVSAHFIKSTAKEIISISESGYIKRTAIDEFNIQGKNTKGTKVQKLTDGDYMIDFLPINDLSALMVNATSSRIKIEINEIPALSRGAQGIKSIKLAENAKVVNLSE